MYKERFNKLVELGRIYPCYETPEELDRKRKLQMAAGGKPVYDRSSLKLTEKQKTDFESEGRKPHWRFLMNSERVQCEDILKDKDDIHLLSISEPIVYLKDGVPLYT